MSNPIRDFRERHRLTARELAERVGVSRSMIGHWETGARQVEPKFFEAIEAATNREVGRHELRPDIFNGYVPACDCLHAGSTARAGHA